MRRRLVARLGLAGSALGLVAGVVQATVGERIPEWSGAKAAPVALGLLTVGLSALAGLAALVQRRDLSVPARAGCALGLAGPGLLCLSTVGRLWYLPAALLVPAGVLCVDGWRETGRRLVHGRYRVLLGALGGAELLMAAGGTPTIMAVGAVGGLALVAAGTACRTPGAVAVAVAVGTVPFGVLTWNAVVPIALGLVAVAVAAPVLRDSRRPAATGG